MKLTDLMIKDLVIVKILSQIPNTYVLHTWTANDYSRNLQVKPIPLTTEILKKNDWYWGLTSNEEDIVSCVGCAYDEHWVYDEGAGEISLFFPKDTNGGELRIYDQRFNRHLEFVWCDTLYVHELQRALRLCGLDEIADNFKV